MKGEGERRKRGKLMKGEGKGSYLRRESYLTMKGRRNFKVKSKRLS